MHVALPGHATMLALKQSNALLSLDLDGAATLALPKDVQRDALRGTIEHVDLLIVRRGEKVIVDIPIHLVGTSLSGTLVTSDATTLSIEVEATHIPQAIEVSIEGAEPGTQIHAGEIALPAGAVLAGDPEAMVVQVTDSVAAALAAEAADEAEAGGAAAAATVAAPVDES